MNYMFKLDDADRHKNGKATVVSFTDMPQEFRPSIGTELVLPTSTKTWTVVRVEPPTNPSGQQNTYFIQETKTLTL